MVNKLSFKSELGNTEIEIFTDHIVLKVSKVKDEIYDEAGDCKVITANPITAGSIKADNFYIDTKSGGGKIKINDDGVKIVSDKIIINNIESQEEKYKPIRASEFCVRPKEGGEVRVTTKSQCSKCCECCCKDRLEFLEREVQSLQIQIEDLTNQSHKK